MKQIRPALIVGGGFLTVMGSLLGFVSFVQEKTLNHWTALFFVLIAEFMFFIGIMVSEILYKEDRLVLGRLRLILGGFLLLSLITSFTTFKDFALFFIVHGLLLVALLIFILLSAKKVQPHEPAASKLLNRQPVEDTVDRFLAMDHDNEELKAIRDKLILMNFSEPTEIDAQLTDLLEQSMTSADSTTTMTLRGLLRERDRLLNRKR